MFKIGLVSLFAFLSACTTIPQKPTQEMILKPLQTDKIIEIDEQFLKKSQRIGAVNPGRSSRKTVLNP